jgi:SAM-dependent methyltransferase
MSDVGPGEIGISYDDIAPHYDATRRIPWEATEDIRDAAAQLMGVTTGALVYEPGVGTGLFLLPFFRAGHPVVGADISGPMLARARERMPGATLLIADAARPPAEAQGAGLALLSGLLHVVPDWRAVLEATYATLAPGGVLACVFGRQDTPFHDPVFDQFGESYQRALHDAGFHPEEPAAREPDIRIHLLAMAEREGLSGEENTTAILTRRWFADLRFSETVSSLRQRVYSWQQRIPAAEHDALLDRVLAENAPDPARWDGITEKRVYRLSVVFLRRPRQQREEEDR